MLTVGVGTDEIIFLLPIARQQRGTNHLQYCKSILTKLAH
jgi:hypothetical protein